MIEAYSPEEIGEGLREKCGVVGVWLPEQTAEGQMGVAQLAYAALYGVQHRGYDGAGLVAIDADHGMPFQGSRGEGKIPKALTALGPDGSVLDGMLPGARIAIGQTRYGTNATGGLEAVQPFFREFVLTHNGHVEDVPGQSPGQGDTEALTHELFRISELPENKVRGYRGILRAIHQLAPRLEGAFSLIIGTHDQMIGVRDHQGYRPLMLGYIEDRGAFVLASEEPALKNAGATFVRDLLPGEVMSISDQGVHSTLLDRPQSPDGGLCIMEYAYFARGDGHLEGREVYAVRKAFGAQLAAEHPMALDAIVAVPESGRAAAQGYAEASGIPLAGGITLNRDASERSFMQRTPEARAHAVAQKMLIIESEVRGQRLGVVDDTIVRGTTYRVLGELLRRAGAAEIHGLIPAAPLRNACYQGIDTGDARTLAAQQHPSIKEMADDLKFDSLSFLSVTGMKEVINSVWRREGPAHLQHLAPRPIRRMPQRCCTTCMDGRRAIDVPADRHLPLLPELTS